MDTQINILSLSPSTSDHGTLSELLPWPILRASTLPGAIGLLQRHSIGLIVCERDIPPYSWKDVLVRVATVSKPPLVIVTSLNADDFLWAEALNWGAYDVLPKPFDPAEVARSVRIAVLHWRWNQEHGLQPPVRAVGAPQRTY